jgi:hypothetical protein
MFAPFAATPLADDGPVPIPSTARAIVNNVGTSVIHLGGGLHSITKTGGVAGYNADAVSSSTITGDQEVILDYVTGTFIAGLNPNNPTLNSTFATSIVGIYMDGSITALYSFGSQVGSSHAHAAYAKLVYTQSDDTFRYYISSDRTNWGSALESVVGAGLGSSYSFDSSLNTLGASFEAIFDVPAAVDAITGTTSLSFAASGTVSGKGVLTGSSSLVLAPTGTLVGKGSLTGSSAVVLSPSGTLTGKGTITGSATLVLSPSGTISGKGALSGSTAVVLAPTGALTGRGSITGSASLSFVASGLLEDAGGNVDQITGSASLTFSAAGNVVGLGGLSGSASLAFVLAGSLSTPLWTDVAEEASPFVNTAPAAGTWTPEPANDGIWTEDAAATGTWNDVPTSGSWT